MYAVSSQKKWLPLILCFLLLFSLAASLAPQIVLAADPPKPSLSPYEKIITDNKTGRQITEVIFPLPPQKIKMAVATVPKIFVAGSVNTLLNVPAFYWSYGCSATSAAMLFGYYDRSGFRNMYTGPTGGGVCPLNNATWGNTTYPHVTCGECPLSATHNGIDGRALKGHVDDYWIDYGNAGPDPYVGNWTEHTLGDCVSDYMGTNQSKFSNTDGGTRFYSYPSGDPLYDFTAYEPTYRDGCHGMKLFAESRGYTVLTNFTQAIYGSPGTDPGKGFTFANYQAEIDAGRPVLINIYNPSVGGHTMLGYGYNTTGNVTYIHNTWDYSDYTMNWGGTYSGMQHVSVSVIRLQAPPPPAVTTSPATPATPTTWALFNGNLSLSDYSSANVSFMWGYTSGNLTQETTPQVKNSSGAFSANLTGLTPSTTYFFKAKAALEDVTKYGNTANFTTQDLVSFTINPLNPPTIAAGRTKQFTATGTYTSGPPENITTSVTWSSNNTAVATIGAHTGLAQSLIEGSASITAVSGNISAWTVLTVGPKALDTLAITPDNPTVAKGRTKQFAVTGNYSDSSTADLTSSANWTSGNVTVATIVINTGLAQSHEMGQAVITAQYGAVTDTTVLTVSAKVLDSLMVTSDNLTIANGRSQQFTATGFYSDTSTGNITGSVTWSSSNTTVARVNGAGLATGYGEGNTDITATSGNISGSTVLTVGPPVIDYLYITPVNPSVTFYPEAPPTLLFSAVTYYTSGPPSAFITANWTSSNTTVATINSSGLATLTGNGTTTITVENSGYTANTTLTVLPDTVAPSVRITGPCDGQIISGNSTILSGTVSDSLASANVTVNGTLFTLTIDPTTGNFTRSIPLANGTNTIKVSAYDSTGNTGTSGIINVEVRPGLPGISIAQPEAGSVTNHSSLEVIATITGNVTQAWLTFNGSARLMTMVTGGVFSANVTLTEGTNMLVVYAFNAGHEGDSAYRSTSGVRMVTLDSTGPIITIERPLPGQVFGSGPDFLMAWGSVDDPSVAFATTLHNGWPGIGQVINGRFCWGWVGLPMSPGTNTLSVTANDTLGNISTSSVTFFYDNSKPGVRIWEPLNKSVTNVASQNITGAISWDNLTTATLFLNGIPRTITVVPEGWGSSFNEAVTLAAGTNTIEVRASNNALPPNTLTGTSGNLTVTLDTTAPEITIGLGDPAESTEITVTSNEALGVAPSVSVNATTLVTMSLMDVDEWRGTFGTVASPIVNGNYTVSATATDRAGNTAVKTADFCKATVTVADNTTVTVQTATARLVIDTTANVTGASVVIVRHSDNPSGNARNPSTAAKVVGAFVEIQASPELRDNLQQIYIEVDYDPALLPLNTDAASLKLYLWDVASGTWQVAPGSGVNTTGHYIYATLTHLSKYGGFGTVPAPTPPPPPPSPPGGGGGGGGGAIGERRITSLTTVTSATYKILEDVEAPSVDNRVKLVIKKGTTLLNKQGGMVSSITIEKMVTAPPAGENGRIVGGVYEFRPVGAKFNPPATLIMEYREDTLPEGVSENSLCIAAWNEEKQQWERTGCTNDTQNNKISTPVDHFSMYAIMASQRPAEFTLSDLTISPANIKLGEKVAVSVLVANTGDLTGNYTLTLKIDGAVVETKGINLDGAKSSTAAFTVTPNTAGEHAVEIGNLSGRFKVEAAPPPPEATPAPAQAPRPASFTVADLSVTPREVRPAETLTISALVTNSGGSDGAYTAVLKINNVEEARKTVGLAAGQSQRVTFTIVRDREGSYTVDIDGKTGVFSVVIPAPQMTKPVAELPVQTAANRTPLILGIIGGIVVIAVLVYLFIWRRRN